MTITINTQFAEALTLAKLISEKTGVSIADALKAIAREKGDAELTVQEICEKYHLGLPPPGSKAAPYRLKSEGWVSTERKRNGLTIFRNKTQLRDALRRSSVEEMSERLK